MFAALALVVVIALLVMFQLALALGAPWGRFAWGGQHDGVLPPGYRIASVVAAVVYAGIALIPLDLAGIVDVLPNPVAQVLAWIVFGFLTLGLVLNSISRSRSERFMMTPVALVLAVLAFIVAFTGPVPRTFEGMVLGGEDPVFCTTIMESYPPQCGRTSPHVTDWSWDGLPAEQSESLRWGMYRFDGIRDGDTITLTGPASPAD